MGQWNKKTWLSIVLLFSSYVFCGAAKENKTESSALIKKYEKEYNETLAIKDVQERYFRFQEIATAWSQENLKPAFEWANRPTISTEPGARFEMLVAIVSEMARKDPKEAWDKVKQVNDKAERESLSGLVVEIWAGEQYGEAEKWVAEQNDPDFRSSLSLRLIQGNKQQDWQHKLVKLYEAPNPEFAPILNILTQNASDEYIARWILELPLKNEIRNQLLRHLEEKLSAWAQRKPDKAVKLLEKQNYNKETDYIWLAAFSGKIQGSPIDAVRKVKTYSAPIRNLIVKNNLEQILKQDPAMVLQWAKFEQDSDQAKLDALTQIQNITKYVDVDANTDLEILSAIQEVKTKMAKEKQPTLAEIWLFVIQKTANPNLPWGKLENLPQEQKAAIEEFANQIRNTMGQILDKDKDTKRAFENLFQDPNNLKKPYPSTNPQ
jgi:hypothetical protein